MKKLFSTVLAICMLFSLAMPAMADEITDAPLLIAPAPEAPVLQEVPTAEDTETAQPQLPSRVEISFRVGESILKINGADVEVATPYVVGEGVTLVPLRVITEAFGATVGWEEATQTVTLDYPGVNIVLQIGNPIAEVNGKAQTLLAAPELPESSTMVPLRFISETFGATVSYDEATEAILVVKEADGEGETVVGAITTARIGDSYYGWSMENPTNMTMTYRRFDGLNMDFVADENNDFSIYIDLMEEDFDLTRDFNSAKASFSGYTLVKADKSDATNSYHIQLKDKTTVIDMYVFATETYYFELFGFFSNDTPEIRDEGLRIMSTFTPSYTTEDTHDLSNAKDGWRTYEDKDANLSFAVPADYFVYSDEDSQNHFEFYILSYDDQLSDILIGFYSVSEVGDAGALAAKDRENNLFNYNEALTTISEIKQANYANISVYEYDLFIEGSAMLDVLAKDVFWQVGDYVYNMTIHLKAPEEDFDFDAYTKTILDSVRCDAIDTNTMGIIMRNDPDRTSKYTSKSKKWSLELPVLYEEYAQPENDMALYSNDLIGVIMEYMCIETDNANFTKAQARLKEAEDAFKKDYNAKTITSASPKIIGGRQFAYDEMLITEYEDDDKAPSDAYYVRQYVYPANKSELHVFIVFIPEIAHSAGVIAEIESIINTFKLL